MRQFSTNHLIGEGYWVWLIPLASGPISIGIVADPRYHPYEEITTLDGLIDWFKRHEPQLGEAVDARRDQVEDFLKVEDFSYGCERVFSARPLVPDRRGGRLPRPALLAGLGLHRREQHLHHGPHPAGPRRRGRG